MPVRIFSRDGTGFQLQNRYGLNNFRIYPKPRIKRAIYLATENDSLDGSNWSSMNPGSNAFSVMAWVKMDSTATLQGSGDYSAIFHHYNGDVDDGWILHADSGNDGNSPGFIVRGDDNTTIAAGSVLNDDQWHLLVGRCDPSITDLTAVEFWLDNVKQVGGSYAGGGITSTTNVGIGEGVFFRPDWAPNKVTIDEVRYYNKRLTTSEMDTIWNDGTGSYGEPGEDGLVAGWHLDEAPGSTSWQSYEGSFTFNESGNVSIVSGYV